MRSWRELASLLQNDIEQQQALLTEDARLKRRLSEQAEKLAIQKKAAYFAKNQK